VQLKPLKNSSSSRMIFANAAPADVGMPLLASYLRIQAPQLAQFLAIDITILLPPPSSGASPTAATASYHPASHQPPASQHHKRQREQSSRSMEPVPVFKYLKTLSMNKSPYFHSPLTT
jgi:hypothetical protein